LLKEALNNSVFPCSPQMGCQIGHVNGWFVSKRKITLLLLRADFLQDAINQHLFKTPITSSKGK